MVNGVPAVTSKQELTDLTGKSRYVGGRVKRLAGASLRQKAMSSGLRAWSSAAVTGKPDAVKVARPVWSGGKTARSYLSLPVGSGPNHQRGLTAPSRKGRPQFAEGTLEEEAGYELLG